MANRKRTKAAKRARKTPREPAQERKPLWKRWWPWVSAAVTIALVPLLINLASAHYGAQLALDQAGEQEASAQAGAEKAKDAELARKPALLARVRPVHERIWAWTFPEPVDESVLRAGSVAQTPEERYRIFSEQHGVMGSWNAYYLGDVAKRAARHQISLIGNRRENVRVLDIRANVLKQGPPLDGALVTQPPEGEGPVREVLLDLDSADRRLLLPDENENEEALPKPYLDVKYVTLAKSEEIVLDLNALTQRNYYQWELVVTVAYEGVSEEQVRIRSDGTADGPAFEATAWSDHYHKSVLNGETYTYRGGRYWLNVSNGGAFERTG
ncbi:hypothetical protein AB0I60_27390 [Actinosynnema sp. NPDC050436]|uniref:hypothetical protein n=1 Tax=Actinosynnema sp. NPDC050436 TaxID=3155659 RepID=UPI0033F9CD7F